MTLLHDQAITSLRRHRSVSSHELCALADVTYRQVDYWVRRGYLDTSGAAARGSGSARRFLYDDVVTATIFATFRRLFSVHGQEPTHTPIDAIANALPLLRDAPDARWIYVSEYGPGVCDDIDEALDGSYAIVAVDVGCIRDRLAALVGEGVKPLSA